MDSKDRQILINSASRDATLLTAAYVAANGPIVDSAVLDVYKSLQVGIQDLLFAQVEDTATKATVDAFPGAQVTFTGPAVAPVPAPAPAPAPATAPAPVAAPAPAPVTAVPAVPGSGNPQEDLFRQLFADIDSGQLDNNWYDNRMYQGQPSRSASFKRKTDSQVAYLTSKFPRADWIDEGLRARGLVA